MYVSGVDIGGMSAKIGLIEDGRVLEEDRFPTCADMDYSTFLDRLCGRLEKLNSVRPLERVGISSCGLIDRARGAIVYSNNIKWENKPLVADVERRLGLPVRIANDAKCAALAEAVLGAGRDYRRVCMITLGTGVGGCFIREKRLEEGSVYADVDGLMGHITVDMNGRLCSCGRRGCLEAYASAPAVAGDYRERTGLDISAREIFRWAREGERAAGETVEDFCRYLANGLVSVVNVLRPEIIVLGGGMSGSAGDFIPRLQREVDALAFGGPFPPVRIAAAELGNRAGMIGAAML